MTTHADRSALYAVLQEVLGSRPADTLMAMIPQSEQLATKSDLEVTTTVLRSDMQEMGRELKAEMADLRVESKTEMADLRVELRTDMADLRTDLKGDMAEIRADLRSQTRTFVVTQTATVFGVAGLVVAIQQLL
jgi:aspartyl/asparaginyl-tRNA synthetase